MSKEEGSRKFWEEVLIPLSRIAPNSSSRVWEVSGKAVYFVFLLELTFWICDRCGYQPSFSLFSWEALDKLFIGFYIVPITLILGLLIILEHGILFITTEFVFWAFSLWFIWNRVYGLQLEFFNGWLRLHFRSKQKRKEFLTKRLNELSTNLSALTGSNGGVKIDLTSLRQRAEVVIYFVARLLLISYFIYFLIIRDKYPGLFFSSLNYLLLAFTIIGIVLNSFVKYYASEQKYVEKLIRWTTRKLHRLDEIE